MNMSNPKSEKHSAEASHSEDQTLRKSSHTTPSRPDIFSRLVKLVGLSEYRTTKASTSRHEVGRGEGSSANREGQGDFPASSGEKAVRKSCSDSHIARSASIDGKGPDLSLIFGPAQMFNLDANRNKGDKKSIRRKVKNLPLVEPPTPLIPIPESTNTQRTSRIPDLSCVNISNFADQDALMETDSIRARAAIAMARAQLEHSRPASYSRKLERSSNHMMMLPSELDEYFAGQSSKEREKLSAQLAAHTKSEVCEDDIGAMRKAVGQSQAMVLTLMAAKEAISQRATARKNHYSPLASSSSLASSSTVGDLPKPSRPSKQFQGLYRAGDVPPTPPPSIPLPQLPPSLEASRAPTVTKRETSHRHEIAPSTSAYKQLPNEYNTDDEMMKHIDVLMQSLADSSGHMSENDQRRPYCSLPSRRGRRSNESSLVGSARRDHQRNPIESLSYSTSSSRMRHLNNETNHDQPSRSRLAPSAVPPVPTLPRLPTKSNPLHSGAPGPAVQPFHGVTVENFSVTQMNDNGTLNQCNFVLSSHNDFGELAHTTTRVAYPRSLCQKPSLPNIPSGHTEKYFRQFTQPSSSRHPTLPKSRPERGVLCPSNKESIPSVRAPRCSPGIPRDFLLSVPSVGLPGRARTPELPSQQTVRRN